MHEILPRRLWIGNASEARDIQCILDAQIEAIVDLACEACPSEVPPSAVYCRFPLVDDQGNDPRSLRLAIDVVRNLVAARKPTLVACAAGMSRSPTIVAAALSLERRETIESWLQNIARSKPLCISQAFLDSVVEVCNQ